MNSIHRPQTCQKAYKPILYRVHIMEPRAPGLKDYDDDDDDDAKVTNAQSLAKPKKKYSGAK